MIPGGARTGATVVHNLSSMPLQDSIQRASKSLAFLDIERGPEGGSYATGFVVGASGEIVTAAHVVADASRIHANMIGLKAPSPCAVVAVDPVADVAIIKAAARDLTPLPLWRGEPIQLGREVAFMGFPHADILRPPLVMTMRGIVANRYKLGAIDCYVIDANASEGMSGGPVFLAQTGEVIGVIGGRFDPGRTRARLKGSSPGAVRDMPAERANIMFAPVVEYVVALLQKRGK